MADGRMKGRVRGLLAGGNSADDAEMMEQPLPPPPPPNEFPGPDAQRALQVLTLAQRTADEHVASAQHQANNIRNDARVAAEQIGREAATHAENTRREATKALSDARGAAEQIVRDAQAHAEGVRRDSEKILTDARAAAQEIAKDAQAKAAELERDAQRRYDEVVGSLATKRDVLQEQIETLKQFDRDYRNRLSKFMQSQLRALGVDEPTGEHPMVQAANLVDAQIPPGLVVSDH